MSPRHRATKLPLERTSQTLSTLPGHLAVTLADGSTPDHGVTDPASLLVGALICRGITLVGPCHRPKLRSLDGLLTRTVRVAVTPRRPCHVERGVAPAPWRTGPDRCAT